MWITSNRFASAIALVLIASLILPAIAFAREDNEGPRGFDSMRDRIEKRFASSTATSTNSGIGGANFCQTGERAASILTWLR